NFRYGRYEVSFESPQGQPSAQCVPGTPIATANVVCSNYISSFFIFRTPKARLPSGGTWREIDIEIQGNLPGAPATNLIFQDNNTTGAYPGAPFAEVIPATGQIGGFPAGAGASAVPAGYNARAPGLHTYAIEWTSAAIRWSVDGVVIRVKPSGGTPSVPT